MVSFDEKIDVKLAINHFTTLVAKCCVEDLLEISVNVVGVFEYFPQEDISEACY